MSILSEVPAQSLAILMAKSPSEMTDDEVAQIVDILRKQRVNFKQEEKKSTKKVSASPEMTLDDLGL